MSNRPPRRRQRRRAPRVEPLENRLFLTALFTAGPGVAPANRPDIPLGITSGTTEIAMEINPLDPANIAVANQGQLVVTTDAGANLSGVLGFGASFLGGTHFPSGNGDPDLAFDSQGRLFYTNLASGNNQPRTVAVGRRSRYRPASYVSVPVVSSANGTNSSPICFVPSGTNAPRLRSCPLNEN